VNRTVIGLDIGSATVKAAQWEKPLSGGRWSLRTAAWPRRGSGELDCDEASRISAILTRRGFVGSLVSVLASGEVARVAEIDLPSAAVGAGRLAAARMELARVCRMEPNGFEFETWDLPRSGRSGEVALGAAVLSHTDADKLVIPLHEAGLVVARIGSGSDAFGSMLGRQGATIDAIADIGASALSLTVLVGGACVYERRLAELGTRAMVSSAAKAMRMSEDRVARTMDTASRKPGGASSTVLAGMLKQFGARIGDEIAVSLEYASHRYPKAAEGRMLAVGGGACHEPLVKAAGHALGLDLATPQAEIPMVESQLVPPWCVVAAAAMSVAPAGVVGASVRQPTGGRA